MSDKVKQGKDNEKKKPGISSGHTTPAKPKRPFSEVSNSSAEEITLLSHMEDLTQELKTIGQNVNELRDKSQDMMTKADMKSFITATVEDIMAEINKNIELTIDIKVKERTKKIREELDMLHEENDHLKIKISDIQKKKRYSTKNSQHGTREGESK